MLVCTTRGRAGGPLGQFLREGVATACLLCRGGGKGAE